MDALLAHLPAKCSVDEAYSRCEHLARSHYENFTVGSWFLPRAKRKHLYAIYAFCRFVDDLGDGYEGDRVEALDLWREDLDRCYESTPRYPYMVALQQTIRAFDIPREPFLKLIQANRMDQVATRYATYSDLEDYCRHSANPVGHMVLYASGYRDEERQHLSNATCTALQLANFWQDVSRDFSMGRIYIPTEDMERFGYTEEELARGDVNDRFRSLMAFEVDRARTLFRRGLGLVDRLDGNLKLDVALFSLGGMTLLEAIERQDFDVLTRRPVVSKAAKLRLMLGTVLKIKLRGRL